MAIDPRTGRIIPDTPANSFLGQSSPQGFSNPNSFAPVTNGQLGVNQMPQGNSAMVMPQQTVAFPSVTTTANNNNTFLADPNASVGNTSTVNQLPVNSNLPANFQSGVGTISLPDVTVYGGAGVSGADAIGADGLSVVADSQLASVPDATNWLGDFGGMNALNLGLGVADLASNAYYNNRQLSLGEDKLALSQAAFNEAVQNRDEIQANSARIAAS